MYTSITPNPKMIDIHMHLVPGVDDGAENMEMALVMMFRAKEQGVSQIIATPTAKLSVFPKRISGEFSSALQPLQQRFVRK